MVVSAGAPGRNCAVEKTPGGWEGGGGQGLRGCSGHIAIAGKQYV